MNTKYTIEFDGGTTCNVPSRGFGEGYGSFQINDWHIQRVSFGVGHSNNSAEIRTLVKALLFLKDTEPKSVFADILVRGDSQIALKWVTWKGPIKRNPTQNFREAVDMLRSACSHFPNLKTQWRGRAHSVEIFGH